MSAEDKLRMAWGTEYDAKMGVVSWSRVSGLAT